MNEGSARWGTQALRRAYVVCAVLALIAIWANRYPSGIDLPQHANLMRILIDYGDPRSGYRFFYRVDFFTPYALVYLVAWPFAKLFGPLYAVKIILSACALATPLALHRWLKVIGGDEWTALFGFVHVFGFAYHWGFLSMVVATPVALLYLAAAEEFRQVHTVRRFSMASGLGLALFATHGVTFGVTMLASGLSCLMQRSIRKIAIETAHFLPILVVLVPWYLRHHGEGGGQMEEWPEVDRFVTLFSGSFGPAGSYDTALAGVLVSAIVFAVGRPVLNFRPARSLPLFLSLIGLLSLPDRLLDTWLIGTRFVHYVNVFAAGAFDFDVTGRRRTWFRGVVVGIAALSLIVFHVRLRAFNQELAGLDDLKRQIPPGSDLKLFADRDKSKAFGDRELGQVPAWITAEQGGFLENDYSGYFQMPVQRRSTVIWPNVYRFLVSRGTRKEAKKTVGKEGQLIQSEKSYQLFETSVVTPAPERFKPIRFAQKWDLPKQNESVRGQPLTVAGRTYEKGIGTRATSIIELRPDPGVRRIRGSVGMDDCAEGPGEAVFKLMDGRPKIIWISKTMTQGDQPVSFDVATSEFVGDVYFVTAQVGSSKQTYADWLEVEAIP